MFRPSWFRPSFLAGLAATFLALAPLAPLAHAASSTVYDIPRLDAITIDGQGEDWGNRGFRVQTLANLDGLAKPPADLDASFRLGWDARGLLVLINVHDRVPVEAADPETLFTRHAIELYLATGRGEKDLFQAIISPGVDPQHPELRSHLYDFRSDPKLKATKLTLTAARTKTDGGYLLEVLLPWDNLGIRPDAGRELGFQFFVDDYDAQDKKLYNAIWYPLLGTFQNPKAMHRLRLADQPSDPVLTAARVGYESLGGLRVTLLAPEELKGKTVSLVADGTPVATGPFKADHGRALAALPLPYPLPQGSLDVQMDGKIIGTVDQPILPPPAPAASQDLFGARMQRTMTLLATSNSTWRHPVKILIYGQSISAAEWWKTFDAELRQRFPYADLTIENRSIGGWGATNLVRPAVHDLYPFNPDLVLFHVYQDWPTGELERILSNIRRYTTADILLWTHHAPLPNSGFDILSDEIRALAQKYNCELVEVREEWRRYLADNHLKPEDLLADSVHPNREGNQLLAALIGRHFRFNPLFPNTWMDLVRTYEVRRAADEGVADEITFTGKPWEKGSSKPNPRASAAALGTSPDSALILPFDGNRVDLIAGYATEKTGTARILIDGTPPSTHPELYAITRASTAPRTWFPAIRRISHDKPLLLEDWTLRITKISDDAKDFTFEVTGSKTGPDGQGSSQERFVSTSGRVVIEPRDFTFAEVLNIFKAPTPVGFEVRWHVIPLFLDVYAPPGPPDDPAAHKQWDKDQSGKVTRTTIAQGLSNTRHTLQIIPNGDGPVPIETIEIHRPPLR